MHCYDLIANVYCVDTNKYGVCALLQQQELEAPRERPQALRPHHRGLSDLLLSDLNDLLRALRKSRRSGDENTHLLLTA